MIDQKISHAFSRPALFLDRDGVLNVDHGYVSRIEQLEWMPGARQAVRLANEAGMWVFVVTNQSGIARGFHDEAAVESLHAHMGRELVAAGARVDAFRYCPHLPGGSVARFSRECGCRKPAPGMILDLIGAYGVDASASLMIGDKQSDLAAAAAAGVPSALFEGGDLAAFVASRLRGV